MSNPTITHREMLAIARVSGACEGMNLAIVDTFGPAAAGFMAEDMPSGSTLREELEVVRAALERLEVHFAGTRH